MLVLLLPSCVTPGSGVGVGLVEFLGLVLSLFPGLYNRRVIGILNKIFFPVWDKRE